MAAVYRTFVVEKNQAPMARKIARVIAIPQGEYMFTTGLSPGSAPPATHYTSSGKIEERFADLYFDAAALWAEVQATGNTQGVKEADCIAVVAAMQGTATVEPFPFFASLNLGVLPAATALQLWEAWRSSTDPLEMPADFRFPVTSTQLENPP